MRDGSECPHFYLPQLSCNVLTGKKINHYINRGHYHWYQNQLVTYCAANLAIYKLCNIRHFTSPCLSFLLCKITTSKCFLFYKVIVQGLNEIV